MRGGRLLIVGMAIALAGVPACGDGGKGEDGFRLRLDGSASVQTDAKTKTYDGGNHTVAAGDTVRMLKGNATLELPGDRSVLLRGGRDASIVDVGRTPDVLDGDAVVEVGSAGGRATAGGVDVDMTEGAVRIHRGLSVTIGVYRGSAEVRSAGRSLAGGLPALRQVTIPASGQVPRDASPLLYDESDPDAWDRQFLGEAIDLGRDLERRSRGFTGQLGPRVRVDQTLLERVLPPLVDEPLQVDRVVGSTAGEVVVGAAIAVESTRHSDFGSAWDEVFAFRGDGARWGLVALDQQVKRDALRARLDDAAGRSPLLFAAGGRRSVRGPTTSTTQPGGAGGGSTTTTTAPPSPTTTTIPTPIGPITPPTVPPVTGPATPVDVVTNLVDALLGSEPDTSVRSGLLP